MADGRLYVLSTDENSVTPPAIIPAIVIRDALAAKCPGRFDFYKLIYQSSSHPGLKPSDAGQSSFVPIEA